MSNSFGVFVFSFNRGEFLANCVASIERCAPDLPIWIIDDDSHDPSTKAILSKLRDKYSVISAAASDKGEFKTGGLYQAMNVAMDIARQHNITFAVFIQDDMQLVRPVRPSDLADYQKCFEIHENTIQVSNSFIRSLSSDAFLERHEIDADAAVYIRKPQFERGKSRFSATGVFSVDRFYDLFGSFDVGEGKNSEKAGQLGLFCGRSVFPNACWLPYPTSFRGKRKSLKHSFFEVFGRSGFYPITPMSEEENDAFVRRPHTDIPVMEWYLKAKNTPRDDVWSTGGGEYNFLAYNGVFAKVYGLLRRLKSSVSVK